MVVEDTGIGIAPDLLPHLFEVFHQGEVAGLRRPGLGLGLALVKGIVERHGGRVWAESEGVGKGSRFVVELPTVAPPVARPARRVGGESAVTDGSLPPTRVLLVEDNPDTREVLADALTLTGYDVLGAGSGEEPPDIMLVDIGLPGLNGFEFLVRARQLPSMADVPAFAVTGWGAEEDVRRSREAGFAGHFVKPVDVPAMEQRIGEWVGGRDTR